MKPLYQIKTQSEADKANIITLEKLRITILTAALVRLEWSENKSFTDLPTQTVLFRAFCKVPFIKQEENGGILLETEDLIIHCKKSENIRDGVFISLKKPCAEWNVITGLKKSWRYGDEIAPLPATARTLDNAEGEVPLEKGIISRDGFSILDDSKSCLINDDGSVVPRNDENVTDLYFFAYGHNYKACLADYFRLTGNPPLLPRWALGNWWSRYHKYTENEYLELMEKFAKEEIPLSVAMIDMDWHITRIDKSIGSGWTGYTWNKEYFPQPKRFLSELHKMGLKVSLNVHPAEGIGRHEKAYKEMAVSLGLAADGKTIPFDIAKPEFTEAYFEKLHHPLEKEGVDFWWVDWQQGKKSSVKGLDPLWLLNHYHYLDNAKNKKRPLILSRYAGPGSQRYPVGFSGDTVISWKSLAFQPYFTASAANIGYGWWSHDIGGHMLGSYDEELQVRWTQFGVFSPVMRLHSSASRFNHKEPWKYEATAALAVKEMLRFRHKMLPYLYTMNERFFRTGLPLVEPLYYEYPEEDDAYSFSNEYFFGSELICAPVTSPCCKKLNRACVSVWLPEGKWTDVFSGITYAGNKKLNMYRPLQSLPLLLKEGGILPLAGDGEIMSKKVFPSQMEIYTSLSDGKCENTFCLYEDDGESNAYAKGKFVKTFFELSSDKESRFTIKAPEGERSLLPEKRGYTLHFFNANIPESIKIIRKDGEADLNFEYDGLKRKIILYFEAERDEELSVKIILKKASLSVRAERCAELLDKANIDFEKKDQLYEIIKKNENNLLELYHEFLRRREEPSLIEAIMEILENF